MTTSATIDPPDRSDEIDAPETTTGSARPTAASGQAPGLAEPNGPPPETGGGAAPAAAADREPAEAAGRPAAADHTQAATGKPAAGAAGEPQGGLVTGERGADMAAAVQAGAGKPGTAVAGLEVPQGGPQEAEAGAEEGQEDAQGGRGSDFARLSRKVAEAGLLGRRPGYYVARFGIVGALYAGGWVAVFAVGESALAVAGLAALMAVVFAQVALVAHDLAHRQVFRTRRPTEVFGLLVGNLLIGMSYGWWTDKHTRHHANPNHEDHDPDVSPELLVWSEGQASRSTGVSRFIGRRQAYLFFPLLTLEGLNLHVSGFRALFRPTLKHRGVEAVLITGHVVLYLAAVFAALPIGLAFLFVVVNQAVFGVYLGCTFAPNHKGMPMLSGGDRLDFLRRQVLTSRNVRGGVAVDVALGGLNYQIEHHLFPSMPTPNLRRAQPIVQQYCAELGVDYHQCGLIESYGQALRHMHAIGAPLRERPATTG